VAGSGGELRQQLVVPNHVVGAGGQQQSGALGVDGHRLAVVDAHPQRFDDPAQVQRRRGGEWTVRE
jgi:hypothetical protein